MRDIIVTQDLDPVTATGASGLVYTLSPGTAAASSSGATPSVVNLTLTVSAPSDISAVACTSMTVTIPMGGDATDLSPTGSDLGSVSSGSDWLIWADPSTDGLFDAEPSYGPSYTFAPGDSQTFTLSGIPINDSAPGTVVIAVTMIIGAGSDNVSLAFAKTVPGFSVEFTATTTEVRPGGSVTLSWDVSGGASILLYTPSYPNGLSPTSSSYTDTPDQTTTYSLVCTSNDQTIMQQITVSVDALAVFFTVEVPDPVVGLQVDVPCKLLWETQQADYVILNPGQIRLPPAPAAIPAGSNLLSVASATLQPMNLVIDTTAAGGSGPVPVPISGDPVTFSVTAVGADNAEVQEQVVVPIGTCICDLTPSVTGVVAPGTVVTLTWNVVGNTDQPTLMLGNVNGDGLFPAQTVEATGSYEVTCPELGFRADLLAFNGSNGARSEVVIPTSQTIGFSSIQLPNIGSSFPPEDTYVVVLADGTPNCSWLVGLTVQLVELGDDPVDTQVLVGAYDEPGQPAGSLVCSTSQRGLNFGGSGTLSLIPSNGGGSDTG